MAKKLKQRQICQCDMINVDIVFFSFVTTMVNVMILEQCNDGLVPERRIYSALATELRIFCTNLST